MDKVRVALLVLGSVVAVSAAFASGTAATDNFHGVRILDSQLMEVANHDGTKAVATIKLGPYASDAVILVQGGSEARFDLNGPNAVNFADLHSGLFENDALIASKVQRAAATAGGWAPDSLRDYLGQKKLFLERGKTASLALAAETTGAGDPAKVTMVSRLYVTTLAAPPHE